MLRRTSRPVQGPEEVPPSDRSSLSQTLGRVCQKGHGRPRSGAALSRPLHPSHRHFQPPAAGLPSGACHLPMEGLRTRRQATHHEAHADGVPAPLLPPCASKRLRAHPSLRPCSPTDSDTTTSPWPKACSLSSKLQKPNLRAKILSNRKHSGTVHVAAARCVLPADSQPWRSTLHDSATISSLRLACARLPRRVPALDLHS